MKIIFAEGYKAPLTKMRKNLERAARNSNNSGAKYLAIGYNSHIDKKYFPLFKGDEASLLENSNCCYCDDKPISKAIFRNQLSKKEFDKMKGNFDIYLINTATCRSEMMLSYHEENIYVEWYQNTEKRNIPGLIRVIDEILEANPETDFHL